MAAFLRIMVSRIREEVKPRPQAQRQKGDTLLLQIKAVGENRNMRRKIPKA